MAASTSPADALQYTAELFIELGAVVVGLSLLARLALRLGLTPIPFYLVAGLAFGAGGIYTMPLTKEFIHVVAEIGVLLLLFMLGLEYNGEELAEGLKRGPRIGILNATLNFLPGLAFGFVLGFSPVGSILLGGVTWVTASSIVSKVLGDLDRLGNRETPVVLLVLVSEDLAMAVYLPLVAVLLLGLGVVQGAISIGIALVTVAVVLLLALKFGARLSDKIAHASDEVIMLSVFGLILLVAGISQKLQVSAAIGAFLTGLALEGAVSQRAHGLLTPLRDLFAATFFFYVGMGIVPASLVPVFGAALALAFVTALTKIYTGWQCASWEGVAARGRLRAGLSLVARGEFSIVIAGLGAVAEPKLAPLAAAYVLILAVAGPILTRYSDAISEIIERIAQKSARHTSSR